VQALAPEIAARLSVIPNGVEPERFTDGPAYAHPRPYVAAVGRLVAHKGLDVLLEAFAHLAAPEVDLLIAGDGPERPRLEALRDRLGLGVRVHLLGAVDGTSVASLYRGARLVACPSRWEGLPLVCLEAMASGRAVVASRVDGIPDAVRDGETGLLVPPEDPVALAAALRTLLEDGPRRERFGARGRALVRDELTWTSVAERYLAVLAEAAAAR
jgi:glycosyltransferase involved in cell wall biosynthesis